MRTDQRSILTFAPTWLCRTFAVSEMNNFTPPDQLTTGTVCARGRLQLVACEDGWQGGERCLRSRWPHFGACILSESIVSQVEDTHTSQRQLVSIYGPSSTARLGAVMTFALTHICLSVARLPLMLPEAVETSKIEESDRSGRAFRTC